MKARPTKHPNTDWLLMHENAASFLFTDPDGNYWGNHCPGQLIGQQYENEPLRDNFRKFGDDVKS